MPGQLFIHPFIKVQINNLPISKLFCAREGPNGFLLIPTICTNYKAKRENGDLDFSSFPRYVQSKRWKPGTPRWENFFREPLDSCQVIMLPETNFWKTAKDSCDCFTCKSIPDWLKVWWKKYSHLSLIIVGGSIWILVFLLDPTSPTRATINLTEGIFPFACQTLC